MKIAEATSEAYRKAASGGQGLVSTADDYLTFARMLLRGGEANGVRLLRPQSVKMMIANRLTPSQRKLPTTIGLDWTTQGFGLGVSVITDARAYAANGLGAGSAGAFGWPGAFGGWWQADPAQDLVMLWLPQVLPGQRPPPGGSPKIPGGAAAIEFQKRTYAALNS